MTLPFTTLKFGAHDLAIHEMDMADSDERGQYGAFSANGFHIRLLTSGVPPRKTAQTALHEALHAVYWFWDVREDDKEERVVTKLSQGLATVLRDNAVFAKWLVETLV